MLRRALLATVLLATLAPAALCQQAAPLTFEAAAIKPTASTDGHWRLQPTPDGYTGMDISLLHLIQEAYGFGFDKERIFGGPAWIDRDKFDLEAKFDPADIPNAAKLTYRQRADMLRALLADRFKLKVHHEARPFPVFNLVIAKGGPKLRETKPEDLRQYGAGADSTCLISRKGYQGCSIGALISGLQSPTGRNVIDKTGLTGAYDFSLRWSSGTAASNAASDPASADPDIFTAVQEQLGLKLEPAIAPLDVLIIDSAEKPSEN